MQAESDLGAEAERIKASGVLGEARVRRLFDYLVTSSLAGQSPKEIAIAVDVFGKSADFDSGQDALVRVYIHKLRKGLEEFYASHASAPAGTLTIPRGEYRLRFAPDAAAPDTSAPDSSAARPPRRRYERWSRQWLRALCGCELRKAILTGCAPALCGPPSSRMTAPS
jgi:hypothetical protein